MLKHTTVANLFTNKCSIYLFSTETAKRNNHQNPASREVNSFLSWNYIYILHNSCWNTQLGLGRFFVFCHTCSFPLRILYLQRGQVAFIFSHFTMHDEWKWWLQGRACSSAPSSYEQRHIQHSWKATTADNNKIDSWKSKVEL